MLMQEILDNAGLLGALGSLEGNEADADDEEEEQQDAEEEEELTAAFAKAGIN